MMPPDLNSLPASRSPPPTMSTSASPSQTRATMGVATERPFTNTPPSPRSPALSSLQAAAALNAGMQRSSAHPSPRFERRRSSLMTNFQLNDAAIPAPGEMVASSYSNSGSPSMASRYPSLSMPDNPQHHRAPSLGEIHQQLENEQEAQVNRLLHMIRMQQDQISALQAADPASPSNSEPLSQFPSATPSAPTVSGGDMNARSRTSSVAASVSAQQQQGLPRSPHQRPISLSRQSSRMSGTGALRSSSQSPMLRPLSSAHDHTRDDWLLGAPRDESAFYQAETQALTRENQMLKQRIRELERQLVDLNVSSPSANSGLGLHVAHSSAAVSPLAGPPSLPEQANPASAHGS